MGKTIIIRESRKNYTMREIAEANGLPLKLVQLRYGRIMKGRKKYDHPRGLVKALSSPKMLVSGRGHVVGGKKL